MHPCSFRHLPFSAPTAEVSKSTSGPVASASMIKLPARSAATTRVDRFHVRVGGLVLLAVRLLMSCRLVLACGPLIVTPRPSEMFRLCNHDILFSWRTSWHISCACLFHSVTSQFWWVGIMHVNCDCIATSPWCIGSCIGAMEERLCTGIVPDIWVCPPLRRACRLLMFACCTFWMRQFSLVGDWSTST